MSDARKITNKASEYISKNKSFKYVLYAYDTKKKTSVTKVLDTDSSEELYNYVRDDLWSGEVCPEYTNYRKLANKTLHKCYKCEEQYLADDELTSVSQIINKLKISYLASFTDGKYPDEIIKDNKIDTTYVYKYKLKHNPDMYLYIYNNNDINHDLYNAISDYIHEGNIDHLSGLLYSNEYALKIKYPIENFEIRIDRKNKFTYGKSYLLNKPFYRDIALNLIMFIIQQETQLEFELNQINEANDQEVDEKYKEEYKEELNEEEHKEELNELADLAEQESQSLAMQMLERIAQQANNAQYHNPFNADFDGEEGAF
jgi:hypothetical protein